MWFRSGGLDPPIPSREMNPRLITAQRSLTVRPRLPESLERLRLLSDNLRWTYDAATLELFAALDPHRGDESIEDPRSALARVGSARLAELAADPEYARKVELAAAELTDHLSSPRNFDHRIAYFSPEYGITESMAQYSGGLGVLAADHVKAASDMGVPLVAVGLFYRHGYFHQNLTVDGWQHESFVDADPHAMPMTEMRVDPVAVELAGREVLLRIWRVDLGRVPLYLLDADLPENPEDLRLVTDRLYGGDVEHRLRQELVLGIGGVRALQAVGATTDVFHTNEGHAGFMGLERIRSLVVQHGLRFAEAVQSVRANSVFTTHTPVPAGIDRFPRPLMESYLGSWAEQCGVGFDDLMALGHEPAEAADRPFNMAVMGMRLSRFRNGVSRGHGRTSRRMFAELWPDLPIHEVPITHVTNGVHPATWTGPEMMELLAAELGPVETWNGASWSAVSRIGDSQLRKAADAARSRLVDSVRTRLLAQGLAAGRSSSELTWTRSTLDPSVPTVGFARRMATHKRAALLLEQPDRLRALIHDPDRPVQFVFAGKAHPGDDKGKEMIRRLVAFGNEPANRSRFVFLEDYDIALARTLVQGVDVWLNTPLPPLEASGTSGMKAALNGALNLSVLDGWWEECFDPGTDGVGVPNGWAISGADTSDDERRSELDSDSLFELLEHQVLPLFNGTEDLGHSWSAMVRRSLETLGPQVDAHRMMAEYIDELYAPAARMGSALAADAHRGAKELAAFNTRVSELWAGVRVLGIHMDETVGDLGSERSVQAEVLLGGLSTSDVEVQLLVGHMGPGGEIIEPEVITMEPAPAGAHTVQQQGAQQQGLQQQGAQRQEGSTGQETRRGSSPPAGLVYEATAELGTPGRMGATVRILPRHPMLHSAVDLGLVEWA